MTRQNGLHPANLSLISLSFASTLAAIHHILEIGPAGAAIALAFIFVSYGLLFWFKRHANRTALLLYALLTVWMIVGFGVLHGLLQHTLPLVESLAASSWPADTLTLLRHLSGLAMLFASVWVGRTSWRLLASVADRRMDAAAEIGRLSIAAPIASLLLCAAAAAGFVHDQATTIRIAIIAPATGPQAILVQSFIRAAQMAKEDLGAAAANIRLVSVDTAGTPEHARGEIDRAFAAGRIDAVLGAVSASGQFTVPHATALRIPHICVCSVSTIGDGRYNFTNIPLPEDEGARWVEEAERRDVRSVAILAEEETSVRNHADAMKREAIRHGIRVALDRRFSDTGLDLPALAAEALASGADLIFVEAFPPLLDGLVRELRRQGATNLASIVTPSASTDPQAFEGVWYTDTHLADQNFQARFERRFPTVRFAVHMTPYAYDSFKLLARALTSGADPAAYVQQTTQYDGVAGTVARAPGTGNFRSRPGVWTIVDGRPRELHP